MKKDICGKRIRLQLNRETLRALETPDLMYALGGVTTTTTGDVTGACSKPKTCNTHNTCTSQFC
ncbi:MAG TPA: hypothetical protein VGS07_06585 [Thermoanaerobaculia bacterium]|jgi:hypothetical protein|nr:hypothetical protein [Thermoanaerobaculia bacterium]